MKCPHCGAAPEHLRVLETRSTDDNTRRRRECSLCTKRFSTLEIIVKDRQRIGTTRVISVPRGAKFID